MHRPVVNNTGAIDENIEVAPRRPNRINNRRDLFWVGQVAHARDDIQTMARCARVPRDTLLSRKKYAFARLREYLTTAGLSAAEVR